MIEKDQTLLFIGDSITDCGRGRPVGTQKSGLGSGYVAFVDSVIQAASPDKRIRILNTGISGNRICDLKSRWESDVLALKPDWLAVMIGINDVWRQFDSPLEERQVHIEEFESTMDELIDAAQPLLTGLVLLTPYFIESNTDDPMRAKMDTYGNVVKKMADKHAAVLVDTQQAFDAFLAHRRSQELCGDRVHPNAVGHMILARAFLDAMGIG
jgi:lysophospholipase L1-like esterase